MLKLTRFLIKNGCEVINEYDEITESIIFSYKGKKYIIEPQFNLKNKVMYWSVVDISINKQKGLGSTQKELITVIEEKIINVVEEKKEDIKVEILSKEEYENLCCSDDIEEIKLMENDIEKFIFCNDSIRYIKLDYIEEILTPAQDNNKIDFTEFFKKVVGGKKPVNIYNYDNGNYIFFKENSMLFVPNNGVIKEEYELNAKQKILVNALKKKYDESITLDYEDIKKVLKCAKFTAKDGIRLVLQCVNFKNNCIAALDGHRLHRNILKNSLKHEYNISNEVFTLIKEITNKNNTLDIKFNSELVLINVLENNNVKYKIVSCLNKSEFINVEHFLSGFKNHNKKKEIIFDAPELSKILKEGKKIITDDIDNGKFVFNSKALGFLINKSNIIVKTENTLVKTIQLNNSNVETIEVYFNYNYMLDALDGLKGDIIFKYEKNIDPLYIIKDQEINLILPVRKTR